MARKEAVTQLKQILIRRRDALRKALAGDLSSLKELRQQTSGDVMDAAMDSAQDEISSQLAEVESRELAHIEEGRKVMDKVVSELLEFGKLEFPPQQQAKRMICTIMPK